MNQDQPRILIVDDDDINIRVVTSILRRQGDCISASSGEEALRLAASARPDVILLDIQLPHMDGYEVCERLKAEPLTRDIPVIFVTARDRIADEERGLAAGAIDYVSTPMSAPILRARVQNHINLKRYREKLEATTWRDGLTEVANRRRFESHLAEEWRRAARASAPMSALLCDIDHFRDFNKSHGHLAGDRYLKAVARCLSEQTKRAGDLVARYAGETFGVVLPEADLTGGIEVAERMRQAAKALHITAHEGGPPLSLTVSFGVASVRPNPTFEAVALVRAADKALFMAKGMGRDRVVSQEVDPNDGRQFAMVG